MLAYKPEAAALYCRLLPNDRFESGGEHQELVLKTFERGREFMVIDLGGMVFISQLKLIIKTILFNGFRGN